MIIAGDVGGTHARIGAFTEETAHPKAIRIEEYPSKDYSGLAPVVREFLKDEKEQPSIFCLAVAGPVKGGVAHPTNLPWVLNQVDLTRELGVRVMLINDLEANAYGVETLLEGDLAVIQAGAPVTGNSAVISAGTGLGEAGLFWNGMTQLPWACEGGHATFGPSNALEMELMVYLMKKFPGHVSWERVLSGPGLFNVYQFLRDTGKGSEPGWLAEELKEGDPSAAISQAAVHGKSELCEKALNLFVALYGSEAGNLALKTMSVSGMYIGGGIAPRILGKLKEGTFRKAFVSKGRMQGLLENMPLQVITNDKTGLQGAARCGLLHR